MTESHEPRAMRAMAIGPSTPHKTLADILDRISPYERPTQEEADAAHEAARRLDELPEEGAPL